MQYLKLKLSFYIFIFFVSLVCRAQNFELQIIGINTKENQTIDSLNYTTKHPNIKSLTEESNNIIRKLQKRGFLETKLLENNKVNDSSYSYKLSLGNRVKYTYIYIGRNNPFFDSSETKNDTIITVSYTHLTLPTNREV